MVRHSWIVTLGLGLLVTAAARGEFEECETSTDAVTIGSVACRKLASDAVGAVTAFSY